MFSKHNELNKLIDKEIEKFNNEIDDIKKENKKLIEIYNDIENNINSLIYLKADTLKKIINKFEVDDTKELYNELKTIKKILTLNKDYKSTLRLFKKNQEFFDYFLDNFRKTNERLKIEDPGIKKIEKKIEQYKNFKEKIKDKDFKISSKDLRLIDSLFENNIEEENQALLLELMKYEKSSYKRVLSKSVRKKNLLLEDSDLEKIFDKYNYDFKKIDSNYKKILKEKANLNNIEEVFKALKEFDYPLIENSYILVSLLLGSNYNTIKEVSTFAKDNKLIPRSLLDISGALIKQNDNNKMDDYSIMLTGSSVDFMKNIATLKNAGISINYIFQGCKSILTMPNSLLEKNLDLFNKYGFSFDYKRRGIIDPSPCALMSNDFAGITDQFIEIHPDGLKYLINNLSNLKTVSNSYALMFYNIYECQKNSKGNINDVEDGPFRKVMEDDRENYQLKAIITRNNKEYKNTFYKNIKDNNKKEMTDTIEVNIKSRDRLDRIIKKSDDVSITNSIFNNAFIQSINKYIDYDNALIYNFDGVRISRLKVLRIYNALMKKGIKDSIDNFMYAITYNSIISQENYDKILKIVKKEIEVR